MWTQRRLLGVAGRYVTVAGKGQRQAPLSLGRWRWPALAFAVEAEAAEVIADASTAVAAAMTTMRRSERDARRISSFISQGVDRVGAGDLHRVADNRGDRDSEDERDCTSAMEACRAGKSK